MPCRRCHRHGLTGTRPHLPASQHARALTPALSPPAARPRPAVRVATRSHVPRMDAILVTVSSCAFDLALFMVMAVIFLLGFVASFTYCFGPYLSDYATAGATLS